MLGVLVAMYCRGLHVLGASGRTRITGRWRIAAFFGGIGSCALALAPAFDALADHLFSLHMLQHVLLTVVIAPLLVLGRTDAVILHALPSAWTAKVGRSLAILRHLGAWIARPWAVWGASVATIGLWHLPRMYAWASRSESIHALEHLMLLATAGAFWWWVFDPRARRRLGFGAAVFYLLTFALVNGFIGAMLTFSPRAWYVAEAPGGPTEMTALEDQQLAGIVMWIGMDAILFCAILFVATAWLRAAESRANAAGVSSIPATRSAG